MINMESLTHSRSDRLLYLGLTICTRFQLKGINVQRESELFQIHRIKKG